MQFMPDLFPGYLKSCYASFVDPQSGLDLFVFRFSLIFLWIMLWRLFSSFSFTSCMLYSP